MSSTHTQPDPTAVQLLATMTQFGQIASSGDPGVLELDITERTNDPTNWDDLNESWEDFGWTGIVPTNKP